MMVLNRPMTVDGHINLHREWLDHTNQLDALNLLTAVTAAS